MTVPAGVSILVFDHRGSHSAPGLLLGKRLGAHGCGQYAFPGGRLEPMESPRLCASRELWEETGLLIGESRIEPWTRCPYTNGAAGGEPWLTLFFYVRLLPIDLTPKLMEPYRCDGWAFYTELPSPLFAPVAACIDASRRHSPDLLAGISYSDRGP